jgi:RimJ/RimL family protein N-acetyltransferase
VASEPGGLVQGQARSIDQTKDFVLGAFDAASEMIGVVGLSVLPRKQERHKALLWGMGTAPQVRGNGVGKALVERTLAEAAQIEGVLQVTLVYSEGNTSAKRLYESCGFVEFGNEPRAMLMTDGAPENKVHMVRMLDGSR